MRIVITGATGAVGTALIAEGIRQNVEMLVICRKASKRRQQIPDHPLVKVLELNMEEYETYQPPEGEMPYDVFYHFAWGGTTGDGRNDCEIQEKNIRYALDAAALAKRFGCSAFVGAGSQAEYGRVEGNLNSQTPAFPENGYGMAKLCAGQMTRLYCRQVGMRHVWTRILSIYGPGDGAGSMVMSAIHRLLAGETPAFTKGEQQWDYLYSGDAAKALLLLGEKGHDGGVYCLGSGKARPLADYIGMIRDAIDPRLSVALGAVPYAPGQVMYLCADIAKLKEDTGFAPEVSFEEGIKKTIMWVKEHG
ncbi:MAG: NAD(P)-dependent oxidoreductase [Lachnospiraceae bacterium]